jgi:hypothetical protein
MPLAALFAVFAVLGLLLAALDVAAKHNSPAPSMYRSDIAGVGMALFVVCGLIALACWASFR